MRLPNGIGSSLHSGADASAFVKVSAATGADAAKQIRQEQVEAINWGRRTATPIYLGPCDQSDTIVRAIYGSAVRAVAVQPFAEPVAVSNNVGEVGNTLDGAGDIGATASVMAQAPASSSYTLVGVAHDNNCGGAFVLGQVLNGDGAAVAGVHVIYEDQAGNRLDSVTSGDAADYGSFKFPVLTDAPQDIYISLANSAGARISSVAVVPSHQGDAGSQRCHYVIWKGVD